MIIYFYDYIILNEEMKMGLEGSGDSPSGLSAGFVT